MSQRRTGPHRKSSTASPAATTRTPTQSEPPTFYGPGWSIATPTRHSEKPPASAGGGVTTEQEARQRQQARFERLAHVVAEPLHRYLLRRAHADTVEDILSETMLVLWRRLDDVPGLGSDAIPRSDDVLPWCYGVARGCLANARRA